MNQKYFEISNRRYLGAKKRILDFIDQVVTQHTESVKTVADIFAGTGEVSNMFAKQGKAVIINDLLHSNYTIYQAFFGKQEYSFSKLLTAIDQLNHLQGTNQYLINAYGDRYFTVANANKIGLARQWIFDHQNEFNEREQAILITSILYATDKVANTCGHYDAYRKKLTNVDPVKFKMLKINHYPQIQIFNENANNLVKHIKADLVYIDPPYNGRQYVDNYHVLENIADWQQPKVIGITRKFVNRNNRKSDYSRTSAPKAFADLIKHISAKYILVSFNNMEHRASDRASSKISQKQLIDILGTRGNIQIFAHDLTPYSAGKSYIANNQELLYLIKTDS